MGTHLGEGAGVHSGSLDVEDHPLYEWLGPRHEADPQAGRKRTHTGTGR